MKSRAQREPLTPEPQGASPRFSKRTIVGRVLVSYEFVGNLSRRALDRELLSSFGREATRLSVRACPNGVDLSKAADLSGHC